jgi:hypothetical protein
MIANYFTLRYGDCVIGPDPITKTFKKQRSLFSDRKGNQRAEYEDNSEQEKFSVHLKVGGALVARK